MEVENVGSVEENINDEEGNDQDETNDSTKLDTNADTPDEDNTNDGDNDDDDMGDWITPSNIAQVKQKMGVNDDVRIEHEEIKCACLTTDFAMQVRKASNITVKTYHVEDSTSLNITAGYPLWMSARSVSLSALKLKVIQFALIHR